MAEAYVFLTGETEPKVLKGGKRTFYQARKAFRGNNITEEKANAASSITVDGEELPLSSVEVIMVTDPSEKPGVDYYLLKLKCGAMIYVPFTEEVLREKMATGGQYFNKFIEENFTIVRRRAFRLPK